MTGNDDALSAHAESQRSRLRSALFDPFVDAVITRKIIRGDDIADVLLEGFQTGPRPFIAYPGLGKTHAIVRFAEVLSELFSNRLPMLILGLTHESFENVPKTIEWGHWQPHDTNCKARQLANKGYDPRGQCDCDADRSRQTDRPTFATVEHVLTDTPDGLPLTPEVLRFPFWVFDELAIDKFVDTMVVTRQDISTISAVHSSPTIRTVAQSLLRLLIEHAGNNGSRNRYTALNWTGADFYRRLDAALVALGSSLADLIGNLPLPVEVLQDENWAAEIELAERPPNFAPRLLAIVLEEGSAHLGNREFNPRIHVVKDSPDQFASAQSILRIHRRKYAPHYEASTVLDATSNPVLLEKAFGPLKPPFIAVQPDWPDGVTVRQLHRYTLGKTTLTVGQRKLKRKYRNLLQAEISWCRTNRGNDALRVGLVTFKNLEDDCITALTEIGIPRDSIVAEHYWNLRGMNVFIDPVPCDVFVLIGYPRPDGKGLYEEACALFSDEESPIQTASTTTEGTMVLRNGYSLTVEDIERYEDERLQAVFDNKSSAEFYQAFHRARPYLETGIKEILVFTAMPVPDIIVDGFLGVQGEMFDALQTLIEATGIGKVTDMADYVFSHRRTRPSSTKRESLIRLIVRNSDWLEEVTGTTFALGASRAAPGAFHGGTA